MWPPNLLDQEITMTKPENEKWGLEYWHPHFQWMRWEEGDKCGSKEWAEQTARMETANGAKIRIVKTY